MLINKINYSQKIKHQDFSKKVKKQRWFIQGLMYIVAFFMLLGKKRKVIKINMEGLEKKPYLLLISHQQFLDFAVACLATRPRKVSNVVAIDAFDWKRCLLYWAGSIPKRKFLNEMYTVKNIVHGIKDNKTIVAIYPEARYTQLGTNATLPDSIGKMAKLIKCPVVTMIFNGHHLQKPTWGDQKVRKGVPLVCTMKQVITQDEIENLTHDEINAIINENFVYDEYKYWQSNNIKIKYPHRAKGLHNVLYKCPHCQTEYQMISYLNRIKCRCCQTTYELTQDGYLKNVNGETIFNDVNQWTSWLREEVKKEIENNTYSWVDQCSAVSMPHGKYKIKLGKVKVTHNQDGLLIEGHYNNEDFKIIKEPLENYAIQTEFNFPRLNKRHTVGISTTDDTIYFFPTKPGMVQKIYFATEELYKVKIKRL